MKKKKKKKKDRNHQLLKILMVRGSGKIPPPTLQNFHPENPHPSNLPLENPSSLPKKTHLEHSLPFLYSKLS